MKELMIRRYVRIVPDAVVLDGRRLDVGESGSALLARLYRDHVKDYPKFFKMDAVCKLGFLATELLVGDEPGRFTPREDRAVLLTSRSGPLSDDRNYQKTIAEEDYFPSPALFVYTLANIVTGEIAIRNKYEGDTTAFELERFDPAMLASLITDAFADRITTSAVCGWVEAVSADRFDCLLMLVEEGGAGELRFNPETIARLYDEI